jgi:trans-2,3-dihydro-3-hydroxyanthranilate isomerase
MPDYYHVDVFSAEPLSGNGLTVVVLDQDLDTSVLLKIAQEFRQYETVFLYPAKNGCYPVRVFTVQEELPFAGHPLIGSAAIIHRRFYGSAAEKDIEIGLGNRVVRFRSIRDDEGYSVTMNQGIPRFVQTLGKDDAKELAGFFDLSENDISGTHPVEVVSTGLEYMLIPVVRNLDRAKIIKPGLDARLAGYSAKFAYLFDPASLECRCWDNTGAYEDVATGSAAGPLIAYLVKHGYRLKDETINIRQGKWLQRESVIAGRVASNGSNDVYIEGRVSFFAEGKMSVGRPALAVTK